jgi:hypothetical protein
MIDLLNLRDSSSDIEGAVVPSGNYQEISEDLPIKESKDGNLFYLEKG